ncbi:MAG: GNAT family N-acetyltransferase [Anaerolineales bacterium]|nr:GNAT family N-acetyltransferase [Anaerolineales bacterium]
MITYRCYREHERDQVIRVIDQVAAERVFLQTERYEPSPDWELLLAKGSNIRSGYLLIVVKKEDEIVGFGRLFPAGQHKREVGIIGIVLLPKYRHQGIGAKILDLILAVSPDFGYQTLMADILAHNFISLHLFQKQGFVEHSRRSLPAPFPGGVVEEIQVRFLLTERHSGNKCQTTQQLKNQLTVNTSEG